MKRLKFKRIICTLLAVLMLVGTLPAASVFAQQNTQLAETGYNTVKEAYNALVEWIKANDPDSVARHYVSIYDDYDNDYYTAVTYTPDTAEIGFFTNAFALGYTVNIALTSGADFASYTVGNSGYNATICGIIDMNSYKAGDQVAIDTIESDEAIADVNTVVSQLIESCLTQYDIGAVNHGTGVSLTDLGFKKIYSTDDDQEVTEPETQVPETEPATVIETEPETQVPETEPATVIETEPVITDPVWPEDDDSNTPCNRYYFYMPEEWYNEYSTGAYIYWWEGTNACSAWPGYEANTTDVEGVYYYDVPEDVTTIIWSNGVDGYQLGSYEYAHQTKNIGSEYYDWDESPNYPVGVPSFDKMIYVIDMSESEVNDYNNETTFAGEWYYYYGNGEYGLTPEKGDVFFNERTYFEKPAFVDGEPEETVPLEDGKARIYYGDTYCDVNVGDTVVYTVNLKTPYLIEYIEGYVDIGDKLMIGAVSSFAEFFPNLTGTVADLTDRVVYFNAAEITDGFDFTQDNTLIKIILTPYEETETEMNFCIEEMVEFFGGDYITEGELLVDGVVFTENIELVTEDPTEPDEYPEYPEYPDEEFELTTVMESTIVEVYYESSYELGDADCDDSVKIKDVTAIQKYAASIIELDGESLFYADVNADEKVNIKDATAIQKYLANIDTGLAIGEYIVEEYTELVEYPVYNLPENDVRVYFRLPEWSGFDTIYCHIFDAYGEPLSNWQSKKEISEYFMDDIYYFDTTKVGGLEEGVDYYAIISADIDVESDIIEFTSNIPKYPFNLTSRYMVYSGYGDDVITDVDVPYGLYRVVMTNDDTHHFSVVTYDQNGDYGDLLANHAGSAYKGEAIYRDAELDETYGWAFEVESEGNWTIVIEPVVGLVTSNFEGSGCTITDYFYGEGFVSVDMTNSGEGHFAVTLYDWDGNYIELLANESDDYSGSAAVKLDPGMGYFLVIESDGDWTVDFGLEDEITYYYKY